MNRRILYFAPGAGLGHLNRAVAVCLRLREEHGADARIVTNSPFAAGVACLARMPIVRIANAEWARHARDYAEEARPDAIVTDTFPYGFRNEWRNGSAPAPLVHVARRLLVPFAVDPGRFAAILKAEPLSADHEDALGPSAIALDGPIRLHPGQFAVTVPKPLDHDGLTLVVHSGSADELRVLAAQAGGPYTIVSPAAGIEYYPAVNLYSRAKRVITAAGYNSMAELLELRDRHTAIAFPRRFDDQSGRLSGFFRLPSDGTAGTARLVAGLLR